MVLINFYTTVKFCITKLFKYNYFGIPAESTPRLLRIQLTAAFSIHTWKKN